MAKKEKVTPEIEEEVEVAPVEEETEVEVAPEIEEEVEVAPVEEEVEVAPVDDEMDLDAEFGVDAESFDEEMKKVTTKYDIEFVSIYRVFKNNNDYLPNPTNIHPSNEGYKAIYLDIMKQLKK